MDSADPFMQLAAPAESRPSPASLGDLARQLDLTPAEIRLLERLVEGEGPDRAARSLGIADGAAATLFASLLDKAGAADRRELEALVRRVAP